MTIYAEYSPVCQQALIQGLQVDIPRMNAVGWFPLDLIAEV
jgi:hypothetical protein